MNIQNIDTILHCQLTVARMGEKELMNWWNTDIAYEVGGATFLQDLLGETMAPLAAGEGILEAARLKEASLFEELPSDQSYFSLFQPEPEIQTALKERIRHFKRYPEDITDPIKEIINPKTDFTLDQLKERVLVDQSIQKKGTSFGHQVIKTPGNSKIGFYQALTAEIMECEKSNYVLHYYTEDANVVA
jgi:hypothetical protein